ncbi:MAG TPA: CHAD domain-containing protein [Pseudomonas sp.]|nr:CHAD domain-containing protein [Pseudomonas sp.]
MQGLAEDLLTQLLRLQIRLLACRERLLAATDGEALHDLRIALRQLRSLLRPLQQLPACAEVLQRAAELGRLSGPLRDLEVLTAYLQAQGLQQLAQSRQTLLRQGYVALLSSQQLDRLLAALDAWPALWRRAESAGELAGLKKRISRRLGKQRRQLLQALADPAHDRHRLRLLIKRLRYAGEAYPALAGSGGDSLGRLKQAQAALGDWHDHWQWLARAELELDLQPCVPAWRQALQAAEQQADQALEKLLEEFSIVNR